MNTSKHIPRIDPTNTKDTLSSYSYILKKEICNPFNRDIDTLISLIMKRYSITKLQDLAVLFNVSPAVISRWKAGKSIHIMLNKIDVSGSMSIKDIGAEAKKIADKYREYHKPISDTESLIAEVVSYFKTSSDKELENILGVSEGSLSRWKRENNFSPLERLIYRKAIPVGPLRDFNTPINLESTQDTAERLRIFFNIKRMCSLAKYLEYSISNLQTIMKNNNIASLQNRIQKLKLKEKGFIPIVEEGKYFHYPKRAPRKRREK